MTGDDQGPMGALLDFLSRLQSAKISYRLERNRDEALMVLFATPGERWEVEFFADGAIEVEVFGSGAGVLAGQEAEDAIERMLAAETSPHPAASAAATAGVEITIRYLVRGHQQPECVTLEPSDYFDAVEPGESLEADGIPRFSHARQYLPSDLDVEWTELTEARGPAVTRVTERFAADGRVSHWQRSDPDGAEELCVSSRLTPTTTHIVRLLRSGSGQWIQLFNVVIADQPDGSETETVLFRGGLRQEREPRSSAQ